MRLAATALLQQLISMAHPSGVKIIGGTITPFEGDVYGFWNPRRETVRV